MSQLIIDVVTPRGVVFSGEVKSCVAPGETGQFQILNQHASLLANIAIGEIKIESAEGVKDLATSGGYLEVKDNKVSLMVETAEFANEIDVDRATAARKRAESRLQEKKEGIDVQRAQIALSKALNRLHIASRT